MLGVRHADRIVSLGLLLILSSLALPLFPPSASSSPSTFDWAMWHYDLGRTGYSPSKAPNTNDLLWKYKTKGRVWSSPVVANGKVFVGSADLNVYCLDEATGALIWSYETGGRVWSSPATADGKVFIGSGDECLYCLDEATGALIWSYKTGGYVDSSPAVANGKLFVGSNDGYVYCLGPGPPDTTPPSISGIDLRPSSPKPSEWVYVGANVTDDFSGVAEVTVYYKIDGSAWNSELMTQLSVDIFSMRETDTWDATVPPQESGVRVDWYIEAVDNAGNKGESSMYSYTVIDRSTTTTATTTLTTSTSPTTPTTVTTSISTTPVPTTTTPTTTATATYTTSTTPTTTRTTTSEVVPGIEPTWIGVAVIAIVIVVSLIFLATRRRPKAQ